MITVQITHNSVTAALQRVASLRADATPVMRAMGTTLKSITEGTFNSVGAHYRPAPWAPKRDGGASNLQRSTTLAKSFHLQVTSRSATVSNPTVYAAIHQFGGTIQVKKKPVSRFRSIVRWWSKKSVTIPARPFFPITPSGELTSAAAALVVRAAEREIQRLVAGTAPTA